MSNFFPTIDRVGDVQGWAIRWDLGCVNSLTRIHRGTSDHFSHFASQVADQYAFIPREAISKFLLFCIDCQRKNSMSDHRGGGGGGSNGNSKSSGGGGAGSVTSERSSSADSPSVMDVGGGGAKDMQGETDNTCLLPDQTL